MVDAEKRGAVSLALEEACVADAEKRALVDEVRTATQTTARARGRRRPITAREEERTRPACCWRVCEKEGGAARVLLACVRKRGSKTVAPSLSLSLSLV